MAAFAVPHQLRPSVSCRIWYSLTIVTMLETIVQGCQQAFDCSCHFSSSDNDRIGAQGLVSEIFRQHDLRQHDLRHTLLNRPNVLVARSGQFVASVEVLCSSSASRSSSWSYLAFW